MSLVGTQLGKYHILKALGRGGMSRVYQAYHPQLDRYVAIKIMRQDLIEDEQFQLRFQKEARAVASLRHPNIVQVHDFDTAGEHTFMVMELLDGDSLKTRLIDYRVRQEKMPYGEIASIMLNILDGLAYAHEEGMIHRDIKPANILLTNKGLAVLADFGIAHIVGTTRHTMSGALMGTLAYMAPEQGLEGKYSEQTDLYSAGVIFYEMLTQMHPYDADTPLAVLMKHLNDPVPFEELENADVPIPFQRIVLKSLSKQPEERYQTAQEMADALQVAIAEMGIILPDKIPPPLTFTTTEAPSESVAVHSGASRFGLVNQEFANDATNPSINTEVINKLKESEKEKLAPMSDSDEHATQWDELLDFLAGRSGIPMLNAVMLIGVFNLTAVTIGLFTNNWDIYARGWTFHLFLLAWGFGTLYYLTGDKSPAFIFIGGSILGIGWLLNYTAVFQDWQLWANIWPAAVAIPAILLISTLKLNAKNERHQRRIQKRIDQIIRLSLISAVVVFPMVLTIM